jgi:hypothetical protein
MYGGRININEFADEGLLPQKLLSLVKELFMTW